MMDSRMVKLVIQFALGIGLILAAVLFARTQSTTMSYVIPTAQQDGALTGYNARMRATEQMPGAGEFDNIYGSPGMAARNSRRAK